MQRGKKQPLTNKNSACFCITEVIIIIENVKRLKT